MIFIDIMSPPTRLPHKTGISLSTRAAAYAHNTIAIDHGMPHSSFHGRPKDQNSHSLISTSIKVTEKIEVSRDGRVVGIITNKMHPTYYFQATEFAGKEEEAGQSLVAE